jgi:hypothetical protein
VIKAVATIRDGKARAADADHAQPAVRQSISVDPGQSKQIRLSLTPFGRSELNGHGRINLALTLEVTLPGSSPQQRTANVTLRR